MAFTPFRFVRLEQPSRAAKMHDAIATQLEQALMSYDASDRDHVRELVAVLAGLTAGVCAERGLDPRTVFSSEFLAACNLEVPDAKA